MIDEKCYAQELANNFGSAINGFQRILQKLEKANVLVNYKEGRTRVYCFNPRYPFYDELKALISKAYSTLPDAIKNKYYEPKIRKRPRRTGKPT
ncbi:MAG: ArsR family transcriptional regulator [Candidatus Wallbacteria bacterium HGW-Wallbacteria-1]|uniref:ArsR family transcriptional regulator n=1 Tax=Candidatus Wallbacteria bacterium HGW-Wallbacteria-1 TaxID=2013854 RepID=A0A2N1PN70_9BACT|nr:MAG: ArsR family transcriptional regulator [Candidatus Wallbacteria bacterium HGW-Wallbacteria-1]